MIAFLEFNGRLINFVHVVEVERKDQVSAGKDLFMIEVSFVRYGELTWRREAFQTNEAREKRYREIREWMAILMAKA